MKNILLDTNIIIYLLNNDEKITAFLNKFQSAIFHISVVTWIEMLVGSLKHNKNIEEFIPDLSQFNQLPLNAVSGKVAAQLLQDGGKKNLFPDAAIAATAIAHDMPLLTNNPKDFRGFKGLKILSPK